MYVGSSFLGDDNEKLMWIQHDLWFKSHDTWIEEGGHVMGSCTFMFRLARKAYMFKTGLNYSQSPERTRIMKKGCFDHRVLQASHGIVAAYYRWCHRNEEVPALAKNEKDYRNYLLDAWILYLRHELAHLTFGNIDGAEAIVQAVVFENSKKGYEAEDRLVKLLKDRYGTNFAKDEEACRVW